MRLGDEIVTQVKSLFISAGHSASDPGASGNGLTEADVVLDFRDRLGDELNARGVMFSRDGELGENLPLSIACKRARDYDVAVEFHLNAFHDPSATGVETLGDAKYDALGDKLCATVADTLGIANRGVKGEGDGQHSRLAFVRAGGVILELFFVTNPDDVQSYFTHVDELVSAVADVLIDEVVE